MQAAVVAVLARGWSRVGCTLKSRGCLPVAPTRSAGHVPLTPGLSFRSPTDSRRVSSASKPRVPCTPGTGHDVFDTNPHPGARMTLVPFTQVDSGIFTADRGEIVSAPVRICKTPYSNAGSNAARQIGDVQDRLRTLNSGSAHWPIYLRAHLQLEASEPCGIWRSPQAWGHIASCGLLKWPPG